ncbi:hypothetical protein Tco_1176399 [Tanacetum coccineum]
MSATPKSSVLDVSDCIFIFFSNLSISQECHSGVVDYRRKLGVKPNKSKLSSSDATLKLVACQVAINSPKVKAVLFGKDAYKNGVRTSSTQKFIDEIGELRAISGHMLGAAKVLIPMKTFGRPAFIKSGRWNIRNYGSPRFTGFLFVSRYRFNNLSCGYPSLRARISYYSEGPTSLQPNNVSLELIDVLLGQPVPFDERYFGLQKVH